MEAHPGNCSKVACPLTSQRGAETVKPARLPRSPSSREPGYSPSLSQRYVSPMSMWTSWVPSPRWLRAISTSSPWWTGRPGHRYLCGCSGGWVARFGVLSTLTSDQGRQFTSAVWASMCWLLGMRHVTTTAYHPQSNGMVERTRSQLKDALRQG